MKCLTIEVVSCAITIQPFSSIEKCGESQIDSLPTSISKNNIKREKKRSLRVMLDACVPRSREGDVLWKNLTHLGRVFILCTFNLHIRAKGRLHESVEKSFSNHSQFFCFYFLGRYFLWSSLVGGYLNLIRCRLKNNRILLH